MNMSIRRTWRPLLMFFVICLGGARSYAGVTARDAQEAPRGPRTTSDIPAVIDPSPIDAIERVTPGQTKKQYTLRCWQNGVLIVERRAAGMPDDSAKVVRIEGEQDSAMRLFDLRNATCLLR
jgi:hypothetical protein